MLIFAKSESNILNLDHIENIFIGSDKRSIKANFSSRSGCELAKYEDVKQCQYALGLLMQSIKEEEKVFFFPKEIDLQLAKQHGTHYKTKSNTHGGS